MRIFIEIKSVSVKVFDVTLLHNLLRETFVKTQKLGSYEFSFQFLIFMKTLSEEPLV